MTTDDLKVLLDEFLIRWPIEEVENLTLQEYVGLGNKDTFCQWVETKTRMLGSIKGMTSIKFGVYERKDTSKKPKNYVNDDKYSWLRSYGNYRNEAFDNVRQDIINIIKFSEKGQFHEINEILLPDIFKWKIAFLYSNERLIPIYKKEVLLRIYKHFRLKSDSKVKVSEIQELMISKKPSDKNVYEYMRELYERFGSGEEKDITSEKKEIGKRVGVASRDIQSQYRTGSRSYIAEQKHNKIQEELNRMLAEKYGKENVILEENYVDVKLVQSDYLGFYEVKSSSFASECVREALGQILLYSYHDKDKREKRIYVVGQYPANKNDIGYIDYIKEKLNIDFEYLNVEI